MPTMDGIETSTCIWEEFGREPIKVCAVSASVLAHQRQRYDDVGFDAILSKPIDVEQVSSCLTELLGVGLRAAERSELADLPPLVLDAELGRRLREASEYYQITELIKLLDEPATLGETEAKWVQRMRSHVSAYDMQGLRGLLDDARGSPAVLTEP